MLVTGTSALELEIMRKVIVATLALTPMLLHAQANSPAKTQSSPISTTLQSKLVQPSELNGSEAAHVAAPLRVSTGVVAPILVHTIAVEADPDVSPWHLNVDQKSVVEMMVDPTGKPTDLKIVRSLGPTMDKNVLRAVSQYRFTPGTLDGQPAPVPVNLEVTLRPRQ
jgi:TonB family protein